MAYQLNCVPVVFVLVSTLAFGQEYSRATFGNHERSPLNTLVVPYGRPAGFYDVTVTCQAIVEIDGTTSNANCLADDRYESFRRQVVEALSEAVMEPARIDGEAVRVLVSIMAGFACREICSIGLFENHGWHNDELGFAYSAPQPVLETGDWYRGFQDKLAWAASDRTADESGGVKFVVSTDIDETGESSRRRVARRSSGYWSAASRAARSLDGVRYIPGFQNGRPIELRLYEYWLDPQTRTPETITLPVRVHLLGSEFVDSLDSGLSEGGIRQLFEAVNAHWRPAGIRWQIESVIEVDAERQLAFRRIVDMGTEIDFSADAYGVFAQLCPRETWLEGGWNVCFVNEFPWVAAHFGEGFLVVGELDMRGEPVQPFAIARELGETLGVLNAPRCSSRFLAPQTGSDSPFEGACATTSMNDFQIRTTRRQAAKGYPHCPRPVRYGSRVGNWMQCALEEAPAEHVLYMAPSSVIVAEGEDAE